jgi:hypothetical protein
MFSICKSMSRLFTPCSWIGYDKAIIGWYGLKTETENRIYNCFYIFRIIMHYLLYIFTPHLHPQS